MRSLVARAPSRLDFGGGWTDVPPYCVEQGGCVCNLAIALYAHATVTDGREDVESSEGTASYRGDHALAMAAMRRAGLSGVRTRITSDFPVGAGLGGSSAAGVAALGALREWQRRPVDRGELAEASRALEVDDLGIAGGRQDHYAAAFGGALGLEFGDRTRVTRIALADETRRALEERCVVAYTGQSRISGENITGVIDAYRAREPRVTRALATMKGLATQMMAALGRGDVDDLGRLVDEHWRAQRTLHPAIPTPLIDELLARAGRAGGLGGKALGASGGGCVLVVAADGRGDEVREAMGALAQLLPVRLDMDGYHGTEEERVDDSQ